MVAARRKKYDFDNLTALKSAIKLKKYELALGLCEKIYMEPLMLERTAEAIRNMDGDAVASLLEAAVKAVGSDASKQRPVVLVACDRMNVPLLKGLREWQLRAKPTDRGRVAGGVLSIVTERAADIGPVRPAASVAWLVMLRTPSAIGLAGVIV